MIRSLVVSAALFASAAAYTAPASAQDAAQPNRTALEGIAAIVNDSPISYSDVRERARLLLLTFGGGQPTQEQVQRITGQALEQLIDEQLQFQKAEEFDVEIEPEAISNSIAQMAAQSQTDEDTLRRQLLSAGVNPASLEDQMRADIGWQRVMGGLFGSRIRISDNQVDDQLEQLRSSLNETQYRVSEIFLYAGDSQTRSQALDAAQSIIGQLRQGADFRVAAQQISSAPTAATGGDMGWVSAKDLDSRLASAVESMAGPGVTDPIEVDNGVYILQVAGKKEPSELTTKVDLIRLSSTAPTDADLKSAIETVENCGDVQTAANTNANLRATRLDDIDVDELGPEGRELVLATSVGQATEIFAAGGGLAVMFVCAREEGAEALPSRDDIKSGLKNRELSMISERELRDMRREATIIYRN